MKIYLICPVRNATFDSSKIVSDLEEIGHTVHFPPRDVDQNDPTGERIVREHFEAMKNCDLVSVVWDAESKGSHFDFGMAYALEKPISILKVLQGDGPGKSYLKVMKAMETHKI